MSWVSYAQNYEDVVLARVLADVAGGTWIDVGAQDPRMDSVTCAFHERGWRGINLEPVEHWLRLLQAARPRDTNLGLAAGDHAGRLRFFEVEGSGLSTASADFAARARADGHVVHEREVEVRTLAAICAEHVRGPVHFLKIDAEGAEAEVLRGMEFATVRPWVVLVEATEPNSRVSTHAAWEPALLAQGYDYAYGDGINRYYLAREHAALAGRFGPPTVLDDFVRREQHDAVAEVEARLADVDALSHRRAAEIDALVGSVGAKDVALGEWQARWTAEAEAAQALRGELGHAQSSVASLHAAADAALAREGEARAELDRMFREAEVLQQALARGDDQRAQLHAALAAAETQLAAEHAEVQALVARLGASAVELEAQAAQLAAARAESQSLGAQLATARAESQALATRLVASERTIEQLSRVVPDLQAQVRALTGMHAAAHAELLRHVGLIDALRAEHEKVLASRSWRVTAPLRRATRLVAALRGRLGAMARTAARVGVVRGMAALALRPFPAAAERIKRRLYGAVPAAEPVAADRMPHPPLPLTDDAERILAQAPVLRAGRD